MNSEADFKERVQRIIDQDPRYRLEAYEFVAKAVGYTVKRIKEADPEAGKHISGQQLCEGCRDLARQQYGSLAIEVLADWGVTRTDDIGSLVFNLVNHGMLGVSEKDSPQDFAAVYAFDDAFCRPFRPDPLQKLELPQLL